jgi:hypothetical protein
MPTSMLRLGTHPAARPFTTTNTAPARPRHAAARMTVTQAATDAVGAGKPVTLVSFGECG